MRLGPAYITACVNLSTRLPCRTLDVPLPSPQYHCTASSAGFAASASSLLMGGGRIEMPNACAPLVLVVLAGEERDVVVVERADDPLRVVVVGGRLLQQRARHPRVGEEQDRGHAGGLELRDRRWVPAPGPPPDRRRDRRSPDTKWWHRVRTSSRTWPRLVELSDVGDRRAVDHPNPRCCGASPRRRRTPPFSRRVACRRIRRR